MINYKIFIGTADKDTKTYLWNNDTYKDKIINCLSINNIAGATLYKSTGIWKGEQENSFIVEILINDTDEKTKYNIIHFINTIKFEFNQNCILLEKQNILKRTDNNEYALIRNLDTVDFWSFYQALPYTLPNRVDVKNIHDDDIWIQKIGPALIESDEYLAAKLSIPLSIILDNK